MDPFTISLAMAGINASIAAYQGYKASQAEKDAKVAAEQFGARQRAISETDMMAGLKVPQLGTELAMQQLGQQYATGIDALKNSGAAGVLGGVTDLAGVYADADLKAAAELDALEARRNEIVANNQQGIEQRRINREDANIQAQLTGAQQAAAMGAATKNQAIASGVEGVTNVGLSYLKNAPLYKKAPAVNSMDKLVPGATNTSQQELTKGATEIVFGLENEKRMEAKNKSLFEFDPSANAPYGLMAPK
jgi:hypothetical protein